MARLAENTSLDTLLVTIRELEARLSALKRTANTVAASQEIALPFPALGVAQAEIPADLDRDLDQELSADSQD
jgi:hypothetical protein